MFSYLIIIKNRTTTFVASLIDKEGLKAIREKRKQKKNISETWSEFKTELTEAKKIGFLDKLEKSKLIIIASCAIWFANTINFLSFYTNHNKITDIAFWIVSASFYLIPANTGISLLLVLIIIISVATSKLKQKMETTGIYVTSRKLELILKNYYIGWFCMVFFTTFILSHAIHSIDTVHWIPVIALIIGYNLFITLYSFAGTFMLLFFNYLLNKFSDYIIDDVNPPQEVTI